MIKFFLILIKIVIALVPMALFYLLQKREKKNFQKNSSLSDIDKNKIVEGEVVEEKK